MGADMNYIKTADGDFSVFDICQAYMQLESDFNVDGWLRERPSNQRRRESIGCQLARLKFNPGMVWVGIEIPEPDDDGYYDDDCEYDDVRYIYLRKLMQWGLPADEGLLAAINRLFVRDWLLANFPAYACTEEVA
jgi:hypothetical protein